MGIAAPAKWLVLNPLPRYLKKIHYCNGGAITVELLSLSPLPSLPLMGNQLVLVSLEAATTKFGITALETLVTAASNPTCISTALCDTNTNTENLVSLLLISKLLAMVRARNPHREVGGKAKSEDIFAASLA